MSRLPPFARLAIVVAIAVLVVGGGVYLLFLRGDDEPVVEAGSRFGAEEQRGGGGTLLDTLAPVLGAGQAARSTGSDPAPPDEDELRRAPGDYVAGLFLVGFRGRTPGATFFKQLAARPYGGVLLTSSNYVQPGQLSALTAKAQAVAREAGHAAPLVAAPQEGGEFSAFGNLPPAAQPVLGDSALRVLRSNTALAGEQLKALGIGVNLGAPNADLAVAGGPGQGRAYSDSLSEVTRDVKLAVAAYTKAGVAAAVAPFPGDGGASQDPDAGPAPVGLGIDELRENDMKPFAAVASGPGAAQAMQMSNAIYVAFDGVTPATLLPEAVDELRDRLDFEGTIISADLVATTATTGGSVGEAAVDALKAGVDLLVIPGGRAQQDEAYRAVVAAVRSGDVGAGRVIDALRHIAELRAFTRGTREPLRP